jgi:ATP:ADP antiporter, AAA family
VNKIYKAVIEKVTPIHRYELARFLCIAVLMFLIAYIHSILHISKDVLVISHLGTESISAIKMYAVLPTSMIFMFLYIKLSDKLTRSQLFQAANWFFISYFVLFALVFYPHREALSIDISDAIILKLPSLKYFFKIVSNWYYSLFYVFAEGWVVIMLSVSFWQTANHITTIEESKRFYPLFGISAGVGKMIASILSANFVAKGTNWQPTLNNVTISVVMVGVAISICLFILEAIIGKDIFNLTKGHLKNKSKESFKDSLKYIASSKTILLITALLLCYNISLNLVEGVWKKSIEVLFDSSANQIHHFISNVDICISTLSIAAAFVGVYILRTLKWRTSALITPAVVFLVGGTFFLFMFLREAAYLFALQTSAIAIAVYIGAAYNIFSRSSKHVLFDPTKEMVYIPLDDDLKTKGKAVAEIVGSRFGKGGGAFIQQALLALFPALTLIDLSPVIFGIFLIMLICWFYSTFVLSRLFQKGVKSLQSTTDRCRL